MSLGRPLFLAIDEVGCTAILCHSTVVSFERFSREQRWPMGCSTTLAAVILDYMGLYCESSWGLGWGHIWVGIFNRLACKALTMIRRLPFSSLCLSPSQCTAWFNSTFRCRRTWLSISLCSSCFQSRLLVSCCMSRMSSMWMLTVFEVFLTFWQATFLSVLSMFGVVKDVSIESVLQLM